MLLRKKAIKRCIIFPPHLACASALRVERGNQEIASIYLKTACGVANKHIKISSLTAEPFFAVKTIDCVHQTGRRKGAKHSDVCYPHV